MKQASTADRQTTQSHKMMYRYKSNLVRLWPVSPKSIHMLQTGYLIVSINYDFFFYNELACTNPNLEYYMYIRFIVYENMHKKIHKSKNP